ncbi:helix-turn-helix domain-containing protein [Bordetella bronchiseptica]|nr:helix-turn-helix domain-containing protein [Bordetella bronchiseptica]
MRHPDSDIIDALGGTAAVARLCKVKDPSVSDWRKTGIPAARRMYLETIRPEAFCTPTPAQAQQEVTHA